MQHSEYCLLCVVSLLPLLLPGIVSSSIGEDGKSMGSHHNPVGHQQQPPSPAVRRFIRSLVESETPSEQDDDDALSASSGSEEDVKSLSSKPSFNSWDFGSLTRGSRRDSKFIRFGRALDYGLLSNNGNKKNNFIRLGRENPRRNNFIRLGRSGQWGKLHRNSVGYFPSHGSLFTESLEPNSAWTLTGMQPLAYDPLDASIPRG